MKLGDGAKYFSDMNLFLLRNFLHSDVLQERNYRTAEELNVTTFLKMDLQMFADDDANRRH
jgi:hypothetical protein